MKKTIKIIDLYKGVIDEIKKYMEAHESDFVDYYGTLFFELRQYEEIKKILDKANKIEIIEEDKKIEKIKSLNNVENCQNLVEFGDKQQLNNHILKDKINEIIDAINELKVKGE